MNDLKKELLELQKTTSPFSRKLDEIGNEIKFVERILKNQPLTHNFYKKYGAYTLSWNKGSNRLIAKDDRLEYDYKPLIEHKVDIRLFLAEFFEDFISSLREDFKKRRDIDHESY
jgi:hypothetical protein